MATSRAASRAFVAPLHACSHLQLRSPITSVEGPPAAFVRTTSDVRLTRVIDVRVDVTKQAAFKAAEDLLNQHYSIDVEDQRAEFPHDALPGESGTATARLISGIAPAS